MATNFGHDISNEVPDISKYEWSWLEGEVKNPLSLIHSEMVEKAFNNGDRSIKIELKRHLDDINQIYEYRFAANDKEIQKYLEKNYKYIKADGIQVNTKSDYDRLIFRELKTSKASIEYSSEDNEDDVEENPVHLFISGEIENAEKALNQIDRLIKNAYVEAAVSSFEISELEIKKLEQQNNAVISRTDNSLVIKALPDDLNIIITKCLSEISSQNSKIVYPKEWAQMDSENLQLVLVLRDSEEYKKILAEISKSIVDPEIDKVERIQNQWLWKNYKSRTELLLNKGKNLFKYFKI